MLLRRVHPPGLHRQLGLRRQINCECHGSAFSIADGSVVTGPATAPLAEEQITVKGDAITLG